MQVTEATFRRFLVDSPLVPSSGAGGVRYGSFHQQYWVDGQSLTAVFALQPHPHHTPPACQSPTLFALALKGLAQLLYSPMYLVVMP